MVELTRDGVVFSDTRLELTWQRIEGATGYELKISKSPDFARSTLSKRAVIRDTTYRCEEPLEHKTTYYWKVRPIISSTWGPWSEVKRFEVT